jgi:hypothetical protein
MSKETNSTIGKDESKTGMFKKSAWPKTPRDIIKLVLNLFLNLFS